MSISTDIEAMIKACKDDNHHGPYCLATCDGVYTHEGFQPYSYIDISRLSPTDQDDQVEKNYSLSILWIVEGEQS